MPRIERCLLKVVNLRWSGTHCLRNAICDCNFKSLRSCKLNEFVKVIDRLQCFVAYKASNIPPVVDSCLEFSRPWIYDKLLQCCVKSHALQSFVNDWTWNYHWRSSQCLNWVTQIDYLRQLWDIKLLDKVRFQNLSEFLAFFTDSFETFIKLRQPIVICEDQSVCNTTRSVSSSWEEVYPITACILEFKLVSLL